MPERLECEVLQKVRYINTLNFYLFTFMPVSGVLDRCACRVLQNF